MGPPMAQYHHHSHLPPTETYQMNNYDFMGSASHQSSFSQAVAAASFQHSSISTAQSVQGFGSTSSMHFPQHNQDEYTKLPLENLPKPSPPLSNDFSNWPIQQQQQYPLLNSASDYHQVQSSYTHSNTLATAKYW